MPGREGKPSLLLNEAREKMDHASFSISTFTYRRQKILTTILFLFVPMVLLVVFTYLPAINMFFYSLHSGMALGQSINLSGCKTTSIFSPT